MMQFSLRPRHPCLLKKIAHYSPKDKVIWSSCKNIDNGHSAECYGPTLCQTAPSPFANPQKPYFYICENAYLFHRLANYFNCITFAAQAWLLSKMLLSACLLVSAGVWGEGRLSDLWKGSVIQLSGDVNITQKCSF